MTKNETLPLIPMGYLPPLRALWAYPGGVSMLDSRDVELYIPIHPARGTILRPSILFGTPPELTQGFQQLVGIEPQDVTELWITANVVKNHLGDPYHALAITVQNKATLLWMFKKIP